ncbi:hypothetical protein AC578_8118 [Pseudocercospora eumusae]|uniref:Major facilitator superfamily (MFS) profile domain-containing protein n=1 Tax=Pseudocercospora eumusae TaxID=321146 RepID=A0A139GV07_9PEZI|nr:hypothetical protein AC578_8118 [Pseudocercospora eumusae]
MIEYSESSNAQSTSKSQVDMSTICKPVEGLSKTALAITVCSLGLTVFSYALDGTIIVAAIPGIAAELNSPEDVGWYGASSFLTTLAFQLLFGKAYSLLDVKTMFAASIILFAGGSTICGAATRSLVLIIGRAVTGVGGAGLVAGTFVILADVVPLRSRSVYIGAIGAVMSIAMILGPMIGSVLTERKSWRWCFYISLPFCAVVQALVVFFLPRNIGNTCKKVQNVGWFATLRKFDPLGTTILIFSMTSLVLSLQWGGSEGWTQAKTIGTLVAFAVSFTGWMALQYFEGDEATLPWNVIKQRTVLGAALFAFVGSVAFFLVLYWLPIWLQTIKVETVEASGIHILPLLIIMVVCSLLGGIMTRVIGYYNPCFYLGTICTATGAALMMALRDTTSAKFLIGCQILFAAGIGISIQQATLAVQNVLPEAFIPAGVCSVAFSRALAGTIAPAIGPAVTQSALTSRLRGLVTLETLADIKVAPARQVISLVRERLGHDSDLYNEILGHINTAYTRTFVAALIAACLMLPCTVLIEWKSTRENKKPRVDLVEEKV